MERIAQGIDQVAGESTRKLSGLVAAHYKSGLWMEKINRREHADITGDDFQAFSLLRLSLCINRNR
jgi:hypothetical protein